jgi:hypothetical protein
MSGIEEKPNKREENYIERGLVELLKMRNDPEPMRRVWRFGIFDKFDFGMGLLGFILGIYFLISPGYISGQSLSIVLLFFGGFLIGTGCVKREWN